MVRLYASAAIFSVFLLSGSVFSQESGTEKKNPEKTNEITQDKKDAEEQKKPSAWKNTIIGGINFSQTSYSNWAKGGQNSFAWNMSIDSDFKRNGGAWDWAIDGDVDYGILKQEKTAARTSLDKMDVSTTVAWKAAVFVNPYFSLGLLSQFTKGFDYSKDPIVAKSNFFDPAYFTQDIGARVKVKNIFDSHLGIGLKETLTRKYNQYADDPGTEVIEKFKIESGITSKSKLDATIWKVLQLKSELVIFKPFTKLDKIRILEVDMNWDTKVNANLTKFIVITFNIFLLYDKDVMDKIQMREYAGIGLKYQFI